MLTPVVYKFEAMLLAMHIYCSEYSPILLGQMYFDKF